MGPITYRIQLDATKDGVQKILRGFFTGDVMSRRIAISILNGSVPLTMGENTAAIMYVAKPNGVTNYNACTIEGNTIYYDVLQADVDANGITEMQVKVMDGERVLYAPFFAVEVQAEKNGDTEAVATPTFTALEEALVKAEVVYNTRLESIDIAEDLTFTATYADGSSYVSEAIKEAIGDAVLTVNESVERLGEIERTEDERVSAENERAEAEKQRAEEFTIMKADVQEVLDEAEELLLKGGISEDKAQEMIDEAVKNKVDKEVGKGLSTNDYSNTEKQQVADNKEAITNITNGTTAVGNAKTLNGLTAEEFVSNENLLINADFRNPVNSSGKTSWSGYQWTIDKWFTNYDTKVTVNDGYITVKGDNDIKQTNTFPSGTYTLSFKARSTDGGTMYVTVGQKIGNQITLTTEWETYTFTSTNDTDFTSINFRIGTASKGKGLSFDLEWAKLELGSIATPFIPPNKEVEKLKCGAVVGNADTVDGLHASDFVDAMPQIRRTITSNFTIQDLLNLETATPFVNWTDATNFPFQYGSGIVIPCSSTGGISTILYGHGNYNLNYARFAVGVARKNGSTWTVVWDEKASKADVLPLDGSVPMSGADLWLYNGSGKVSCDGTATSMYVQNANDSSNRRLLRLMNKKSKDNVGFALQLFDKVDGVDKSYDILHTGNSQKVVTSASAPSDISALWVDTTNKKVKAYIDGAWTAMA